VVFIWSKASQMRWRAVGAPIVKSVMDMSLSIDPTRPTILRWPCASASSFEILPEGARFRESLKPDLAYPLPSDSSFWIREGHSARKISAPVRDPSPPHTTIASIPSVIRLSAAASLPSGVRNAAERAVPISVPPCS
jgi:hypothetical protein